MNYLFAFEATVFKAEQYSRTRFRFPNKKRATDETKLLVTCTLRTVIIRTCLLFKINGGKTRIGKNFVVFC